MSDDGGRSSSGLWELRDECLNVELFGSMANVMHVLAAWRGDYDNQRPHNSLDDDTPAEFAAKGLEGTVPSRRQERPAGEAGLPQCVN
jgi:transposase InsO family protein